MEVAVSELFVDLAYNVKGERYALPGNAVEWKGSRIDGPGGPKLLYDLSTGLPQRFPIDATAAERDGIVARFRRALEAAGMNVPMATTNLFTDPVFKDGAFTSHDPRVRAYAVQKTMRAMDLGVELGARTYVFWGGREGAEVDAAKDPVEAIKRFREAIDFLCEYARDQRYDLRFALEAKPNEPRGDIYFPTTASYLGFIGTLAHPEMVGVNPEVAHEHMIGLNFYHVVAQAIEAGKLFHIDLNDQ